MVAGSGDVLAGFAIDLHAHFADGELGSLHAVGLGHRACIRPPVEDWRCAKTCVVVRAIPAQTSHGTTRGSP
jgi:hypothetical protein